MSDNSVDIDLTVTTHISLHIKRLELSLPFLGSPDLTAIKIKQSGALEYKIPLVWEILP